MLDAVPERRPGLDAPLAVIDHSVAVRTVSPPLATGSDHQHPPARKRLNRWMSQRQPGKRRDIDGVPRRRWLYQSTHSAVASSTWARLRHGRPGLINSVL